MFQDHVGRYLFGQARALWDIEVEYLFGLFANLANSSNEPNAFSLLGIPMSYEITLRKLTRVYDDWASSEGQRQLSIQPFGAATMDFPGDPNDFGDWRFSVGNNGVSL